MCFSGARIGRNVGTFLGGRQLLARWECRSDSHLLSRLFLRIFCGNQPKSPVFTPVFACPFGRAKPLSSAAGSPGDTLQLHLVLSFPYSPVPISAHFRGPQPGCRLHAQGPTHPIGTPAGFSLLNSTGSPTLSAFGEGWVLLALLASVSASFTSSDCSRSRPPRNPTQNNSTRPAALPPTHIPPASTLLPT